MCSSSAEVDFHTSKLYTVATANYRTSRIPPNSASPFNPAKLPFNPQFRPFPVKHFTFPETGCYHCPRSLPLPSKGFTRSQEGPPLHAEPRGATSRIAPHSPSCPSSVIIIQSRPRLNRFHQSRVTKSLSPLQSAYEKHTRNSRRIRTSKTQDLKLFGINTYKKTEGGRHPKFRLSDLLAGRSLICPRPLRSARPKDHSAPPRHQPTVAAYRSLLAAFRIQQAGV